MVYFIKAEVLNLIKIGVAGDPFERLYALQISSPAELKIIGVIDKHYFSTEKQLHKKFEHLRVRGEWFKESEELLQFISDNCQIPSQGKPKEIDYMKCRKEEVIHILNQRHKFRGVRAEIFSLIEESMPVRIFLAKARKLGYGDVNGNLRLFINTFRVIEIRSADDKVS